MSDKNTDNSVPEVTRRSISRSPSRDVDVGDDQDKNEHNTLPKIEEKRSSLSKRSLKKQEKNSDEEPSESESISSFRTGSLRSRSEHGSSRSSPAERKACPKARTCCSVFFFLCKMTLVLSFIALLILLVIGFFLSKLEFQCKTEELSSTLYSSIYGQDVAIKTTLGGMTDFCSGNYDQPLTLVFWGPTGVGKTAFASIFTHHFDSNGQVVPSEHFKAAKYKDWYGNRLRNKPFVYTIDDVMSVEEMGDIAANTDEFSFPLILVITTSLESNLLNESFIEWCVKGGDEMDFTYRGKDPLWLTELRPLNPVVVPFLPLSRTSIKLCIEKTLNRLKMNYVKDDIEKIASEFDYFHNNKRLFSKIGCKRVNDKIFSVLSP